MFFFFFNDTATTEIYTLSLHDALPIFEFPETAGRTSAEADTFLRNQGIVIRDVKVYGLPTCLRASIGTVEQNDDLIAAIEGFSKS